jgi:outer membrane protein TolC
VGRIRNLSEASLQQFLQSQDNRRNVQIGLVADVANAWLTLAADQARLQLARDTLDSRIKALS